MYEQLYQSVYENTPVAVILISVEGTSFTIADVNRRAQLLLGNTRDALVGRNADEVMARVDSSQRWNARVDMQKALLSKETQYITTVYKQSADASERHIDITLIPLLEAGVVKALMARLENDATQGITDTKNTREELVRSKDMYQTLLEAVDGIVWEADAETFNFTFVSESAERILGYTAKEWLATPDFWKDHIYAEDVAYALEYCHVETRKLRSHNFDYRMIKADGTLAWIRDFVTVISVDGKAKWLRGMMMDVTESKLLADLDHLEKEMLEMSVQKYLDVDALLNSYMLGIERLFPHMKCSIVGIKNDKLRNWAAPSLPEDYLQELEGVDIGPQAGSCGAAAYLKEVVIVADIANDERWANCKATAIAHNLLACWSYPVMDANEEVIAVMGVYYNTVKEPDKSELEVIERTVAILKLILENQQYSEMMDEMNMVVLQGQSLANFGSWQWDIENNKVTWSDVLYKIYGLDKKNFTANYESYIARLHPDDKERVEKTIQHVIETHADTVFEERIIRPKGEVRHLKSWGRLIVDSNTGKPLKMIGACLDITAIKETENRMQEIAWQQSHVVRAPLATLMGLVNLLSEETLNQPKQHELLLHIRATAHELDEVIRRIADNTNPDV